MPRRHDILESWFAHRQIDRRQLDAGRRFRDLFDVSGVGGHAVIDLGAPKVSLQERTRGAAGARIIAQSELQALRDILGAMDFALVSRVIGAGHDVAGVEAPGGQHDAHAATDAEKRYLAHRIRDALGIMAARFALDRQSLSLPEIVRRG